jgi:hypothetical protein
VLKHRLVQALLLVVPATAASLASATIVHAVEECRLKPGAAAPSDSRWLYRISRADHRRCWFLSAKAVGVRSQLARGHRHLAGDTDAMRQDQQRDSDLQIASAPTGETDVAVAAEKPPLTLVDTPSVEQSSDDLVPRSVPTIAYRLPSPRTQAVPIPAGAEHSAERASTGAGKTNVILLAGAAAVGLLFAGGVFHFTRHLSRGAHKQLVPVRNGISGPLVSISPVAAKRPFMTADLPHDLTPTLLELERHLKPALQECNLRSSRGQSSAISLPHVAAWLSRPQAKPTTEPASHQLADA